jgi:predicted translin family RNA/ssDNA-binding protein
MIQECRRNNVELKYNFEKLNESEIIEIFTKIFNELSIAKIPIVFKNELNQYNDKLNEIILGKILTDAEINNLVKELRPVVVKELKEQMLKTIKDYDWTEAVHETINDMDYIDNI